jgi:hypothetical protein
MPKREAFCSLFKKIYRQKAAPFDSGAGYRISGRCAPLSGMTMHRHEQPWLADVFD